MTGATGVHLLLWSDDRHDWLLPHRRRRRRHVPVSGTGHEHAVPMSVLRYAQRMGEPLVVADATRDDRFARDPYFTDVDCCSLLAVPILSRGALQAVLLLENRLIRGAFTTERLDAVKLIAGQLAVSLDNAQLYAELPPDRRRAGGPAAGGDAGRPSGRGRIWCSPRWPRRSALSSSADSTTIVRFEPDGEATVMGGDGFEHAPPGSRAKPRPAFGHGVRSRQRTARLAATWTTHRRACPARSGPPSPVRSWSRGGSGAP